MKTCSSICKMKKQKIMASKFTVLFQKHKKHLSSRLQVTPIGELCRYGWAIFLSAWIFQGMRISNWREHTIRIGIDVVLTCSVLLFTARWWAVLLAFIVSHTLNFMFNGQFFAMFTHMGATGVTAEKFLEKTIKIQEEVKTKEFCAAAVAYGSLSRGCFKSTSDIDLRLVPQNGEANWWKLAFWAVSLRARAFVWGYPLDMYCYDADVLVKKMRSDELPIVINEKNGSMKGVYPERVEFEDFVNAFKGQNLKIR